MGARPSGVNPLSCPEHPARASGGPCAGCGRGLCEECIAEERDGAIRCRACAVAHIGAERDASDARGAAADAHAVRTAGRGRRVLLGAALALLAAEVSVIAADPPALFPAEPSPWTVGAPAPRQAQGWECARRVFSARIAVDVARATTGALPARLEGEAGGPPSVCPGTGRPLAYAAAGAGSVACPDPASHGVAAIRAAAPGRPPEVVASSGRGQ